MGQETEHLFKFDDTVTVTVELAEEGLNVGSGHTNLNTAQHGVKFDCAKDAILVRIEFTEDLP